MESNLAALYGVETRRLNEQVRRNRSRFPEDFIFELTAEEFISPEDKGSNKASKSARGKVLRWRSYRQVGKRHDLTLGSPEQHLVIRTTGRLNAADSKALREVIGDVNG